MVGEIPTSGNTGHRALMASNKFYIYYMYMYYAPTGCGLLASNWRSTYCRIPPLA
jgi:hypothetical protein